MSTTDSTKQPIVPGATYNMNELSNITGIDRRVLRKQLYDKKEGGIQYAKFGHGYYIKGEDFNSAFGSQTFKGEKPEVKPESGATSR